MTMARARCRLSRSTSPLSRLGSCWVLASVTCRPARSAARVTPAAIEEKYGSAMSCTTRPSDVVRPRAIACAFASGV